MILCSYCSKPSTYSVSYSTLDGVPVTLRACDVHKSIAVVSNEVQADWNKVRSDIARISRPAA